jgi:uracil-DNA glycosylase
MDARARLRQYLEQRRDTGETELVLDSMTVDDVMRLLGAASARRTDAPEAQATNEARDWREVLRTSGGAPVATPQPPRVEVAAPVEPPGELPPRPIKAPPADLSDIPVGIKVGKASRELFGPLSSIDTLDALASTIAACTRCPLYSTATHPVPGEGNPNADFVCVGEAPGASEDASGRPFVGQAGQLLTKILAAINLRREDVFICNVLKHRPPNNRNPLPEEVTACSPYLVRQLELTRPKVILALGTFAAQTLLDTKLSISRLRGSVHEYYGVPLVVTYHPAALLRNPGWKRPTWEDVQLARRILDRAAGA